MENAEWQKFLLKLRNTVDNITESVLKDDDEVKAMGELALLEKDIAHFLTENWVMPPKAGKNVFIRSGRIKVDKP